MNTLKVFQGNIIGNLEKMVIVDILVLDAEFYD